ncbi:MAG: hypothetical protein IPK52_20680 [Chloroflexi bacterium]|nr:hypothetical protein [Chloroflexota bacterium]
MMRRAHLRIEDLSLMAILLIAAFPRLWDIGAIRHNIDHAYTIWQALDTLEHGTLPVIGQSTSVLFANPALTGYLFVPVLALTRSAAAVYVLVIALNTAGVYFCYRTAADLTGKRWLGLIAAWLMAVNPWVIEFSRTTWVQCLLPFLMSFVAWLLFPVLLGSARRPDRRLAAALAAAAVTALTWLLAFFIAAPIAALLLIFRRNVPRKGFLIGAGMCAAATAIFVIGLLSNPAAGFARAGNFTSGAARLKSDALLHAIRLVTGTEYSSVKGAALADAGAWQTSDLVVHYGLLALLAAGVLYAANALRKPNPMRGAAVTVLIWFFLPVAAMSYNGSPIHPHYMLLTLPAGFVLAAWGAELVMRNTVSRVLVGAFLIGAGMVSGGNSLRAAYETRVAPGDDVALGIPLEAGLRVGAAINALQTGGRGSLCQYRAVGLEQPCRTDAARRAGDARTRRKHRAERRRRVRHADTRRSGDPEIRAGSRTGHACQRLPVHDQRVRGRRRRPERSDASDGGPVDAGDHVCRIRSTAQRPWDGRHSDDLLASGRGRSAVEPRRIRDVRACLRRQRPAHRDHRRAGDPRLPVECGRRTCASNPHPAPGSRGLYGRGRPV